MKTRARAALTGVVLLTALGTVLSGCSGATPKAADTGAATATASPAHTSPAATSSAKPGAADSAVDKTKLGKAMDRLVFQGSPAGSTDGGACFARAVLDSGMSRRAIVYVQDSDDTSIADLGVHMKKDVGAKDARILLSQALRAKTDTCVSDQFATPTPTPTHTAKKKTKKKDDKHSSHKKSHEKKKKTAKKKAKTPSTPTPDLKPVYHFKKGETIDSTSQVEPGLVSMFTSFGNAAQAAKIKKGATCMTKAVLDAGFSQATLRFIAGGARIGIGSVEEYLPNSKDAVTWNSAKFSQQLSACIGHVRE